jgi:hypothetical protein
MNKFKFDQLDAGENAFFSRSLEQIRSQVLEVRYPALLGRSLVPVSNETNPGAETIVTQFMDKVGEARVTSDYNQGGPRVDVVAGEYTSKIRTIDASYAISNQEMRAAKFAGRDLSMLKAKAARDAIERKLDDCIMTGDPNGLAFRGLMNQVGIATYAIATPWASATPAQILADLQAIERQIVINSKEVETPTDLVLPLSAYHLLNAPRSTTSDMTIMQYFIANAEYVKTVSRYHKVGSTGLCYAKDPSKLHAEIPMEFMQYAPQMIGKEVVTECEARSGGVIVDYPGSMLYVTGF